MKKIFKISSLFSRSGRKSPAETMPRLEVETMDAAEAASDAATGEDALSRDLSSAVAEAVARPFKTEISDSNDAASEVRPKILDAIAVDAVEIEVDGIEVSVSEENFVDEEAVGTVVLEKQDSESATPNLPVDAGPVVQAFRTGGEKRHRFGEYVFRKGLISKDALHAASLEQDVTNAKIGQILVANGFLSDKDRVEAILATEHSRIAQEKVSRCLIPVDVLAEHNIMISAEQEDKIYVASAEDERLVKMVVQEYYPTKEIVMVAYDASAMNLFLAQMRKMSSIDDPANAEELMLDRIVYNALTDGASDIHIEPRAASYSILYRKDGVRRLIHTGALAEYQVLIAKIKDRAAMDLAERRKPQDGGFQMEFAGRMIDLRIATIPSADGGEKCTIRLLDSDRVTPSLEKLGISEVTKWRRGMRHQFGICLICGPTGSGKTTTMNASIREMDRFGKAINSIEDPVEYRIPYVTQVSVNKQVGLDFPNAIRSFMRHDPDVIIVGEVRDEETARNAIKAAETGHLVIATLHTGSIVGAITRLKELGIEPHELRYLVRAIMVQSLVRTTCKACGGTDDGKAECRECGGSGYRGRTVASECEYFATAADVQKIIPEPGKHIEETWMTKEQDAVNKMYAGMTDLAELDRVFGPAVEQYLREEDRP
ncbi:GspE/PulE family protein [Rhizobium sp. BK176]|uniref:GspE/PulE family protein n=1 Tax=Rhizobium sp. BK176 TaxID=2587071 RepID=UPI002166D174|nr:GspE/PulE family protein [Rhizobium sp. BK176]MCS4089866.1 general secretion pathway protein E [Rhizobium sp. BK176]